MVVDIRVEQLREFENDRRNILCDQIATMILRDYVKLANGKSPEELNEAIRISVACAIKLGIQSGNGVAAYTTLALVAGSSFHTSPEVLKLFDGSGRSPDMKIRTLFKHSIAELKNWANTETKS